jgi:hypothetical protein
VPPLAADRPRARPTPPHPSWASELHMTLLNAMLVEHGSHLPCCRARKGTGATPHWKGLLSSTRLEFPTALETSCGRAHLFC